jgi:CAAX prenyl protease-like protein
MWQFLAIRFFGLVLVVPFIEEFFLRGFLMRYCEDPDWDEIPLGVASPWVWVVPTVYGVIAHPAEMLSAIVWFSMVSWLYKKTGSVWDCVMAHLVTNLLLGLYIVNFDAWHLW